MSRDHLRCLSVSPTSKRAIGSEDSHRTVRRDWDLAKAWLFAGVKPEDRATEHAHDSRSVSGRLKSYIMRLARRTAEERAALLAEADPELRREVESLARTAHGGEFLDRPAIQNAPQLLEDSTVTD